MQRTLSVIITTYLFALGAGSQDVKAADFGGTALRGSIQPQQQTSSQLWDGVYVGALGGYSSGTVNKTKGYGNIAPQLNGTEIDAQGGLQNTFVTPSRAMDSASFGGFVGYNSTWEDAVVGVEADYTRTGFKTDSSLSIGRQFKGTSGYNYNHTATMTASSKITDIATLRGRIGYAIGNALPFMTLGVAFGHGTFSNNSSLNGVATDSATPQVKAPIYYDNSIRGTAYYPAYSGGYTNRDKFAAGLALGAGLDYAFSSAIFLRAEYQHIRFNSFGSGQVAINNARAGVAAKF